MFIENWSEYQNSDWRIPEWGDWEGMARHLSEFDDIPDDNPDLLGTSDESFFFVIGYHKYRLTVNHWLYYAGLSKMQLDDDFRSLVLHPPFCRDGIVFRSLEWSDRARRNRRTLAKDQLEENEYRPGCDCCFVRNPLVVDNLIFVHPDAARFKWDRDGNFLGLQTSLIPENVRLKLTDYAEKYMGLHNIDWDNRFEMSWVG